MGWARCMENNRDFFEDRMYDLQAENDWDEYIPAVFPVEEKHQEILEKKPKSKPKESQPKEAERKEVFYLRKRCRTCGQIFYLTLEEVADYLVKSWRCPEHCEFCRRARRAANKLTNKKMNVV